MGFLAYILLLVGITAVVSFVIAAFIRSNPLSIIASAVTAESLVVLYGLHDAASSPDAHDVLLAVNITWMICTPIFIGAAVGFTFLARRFYKNAGESIAHQPSGQIFPWPQGTVLTALDEATIALPMAIFGKDEPMGSVVLGPADIQMHIRKEGETFLIRLQPGMSVSLTKSCQAHVVADDGQPRRFKLSGSPVTNAA